jgi:hypothetical protein
MSYDNRLASELRIMEIDDENGARHGVEDRSHSDASDYRGVRQCVTRLQGPADEPVSRTDPLSFHRTRDYSGVAGVSNRGSFWVCRTRY